MKDLELFEARSNPFLPFINTDEQSENPNYLASIERTKDANVFLKTLRASNANLRDVFILLLQIGLLGRTLKSRLSEPKQNFINRPQWFYKKCFGLISSGYVT